MPIYEFRCEECGKRFDSFFRSSEEVETKKVTCSKCGSEKVRKLFSAIGIGGLDKGSVGSECSTTST
ncbi:MAG: zinc ribbon domain-containing protein [Actinomycetota bacterium]|nr:zinc ribbon domain-containing protein [Actinomycetota bacterium]